jgi:polysaccharide export outer membrane protein
MIIDELSTKALPLGMGLLMALVVAMTLSSCATQPSSADPTAAKLPPVVENQPLPTESADYVIGAGDVLEISVWKDEALTRQVVVLPDGTLSFPLIGKFNAEGKTVDQLQSEMEKKLIRYVPEPELSVIVQQVNSQVVYVIGKVNRPGQIQLNRQIDVLQALTMAGGLNLYANEKDIRIIRRTDDQAMVIRFNYEAVTEDNRLEENIMLQRGDVIVVK